ncbi:MAG TPA: DUF4118 domain-containing protein, partial [Actinomycetes bacterium]|nr:DUF4118 domain-containing protein [Actinomycetes bacterium]
MTEVTRAERPLVTRPERLSATRRGTALVLAVAGLPLMAALLGAADGLALASSLLLLLLGVVVVSVVGGTAVGLGAAALSFLLANWFLIPPLHTLRIEDRDNVVALVVFLAVALTTSVLVELAARRRAAMERSRAESVVLARMATRPVATSVESVLEDVASTFGLTSVALVGAPGSLPVASHGPAVSGTPTVQIDAAPGLRLVADGPPLFAEDRRLLGELAAAAARALEEREMSDQAARARELAEVDRVRSALLAAVGHDLRTPLATVKAA